MLSFTLSSLPHRDVQMEAGGDTAAPAPGDAEDLEDTRFPSEEVGNGGGVHEDLPDPRDGDLEETGMLSPHQGPGRALQEVSLLRAYNEGPVKSLWGLTEVA